MVVAEQRKTKLITAEKKKVQIAFLRCCDGGVAKLTTEAKQATLEKTLLQSEKLGACFSLKTSFKNTLWKTIFVI